jgi:DNA-binding MarR family transcriptional regulator
MISCIHTFYGFLMDALKSFGPRGFDCLCGNARMAARALTAVYDEKLRPSGLRASQLAVLWAVVALPGSTVNSLAKTIAMDSTTLTRNLKILERDGQVTIGVGSDRRERQVNSTAKGKRAFAKAMPLWQAAQSSVVRKMDRKLNEINSVLLRLSHPARH